MKIAVLSGKGGAGKTFVSVNLAAAAGQVVLADCDVEEPNAHLFLNPGITVGETVTVPVPAVDETLCRRCRRCVEFCRFNALAFVKNKVIVFEELCHSCGGCSYICPDMAVYENERPVGVIRSGTAGGIMIYTGTLNTGEASGVPVIKKLLGNTDGASLPVIVDCPPGSACTVMECVRKADYCVLVAEPTVFGMHDLDMVYELVTLFGKRCGVVLNKCGPGAGPADGYCQQKGIDILCSVPFDRSLAAVISEGRVAATESAEYGSLFGSLYDRIIREVRSEAACNSER
jgi:MinD superfamily P-loop ATPase